MIILDENIAKDQREKLRLYKIRFRHIGSDIGKSGMDDYNQILPLLLSLKSPTFFTRDADYSNPAWRHQKYCLVFIQSSMTLFADTVKMFLKSADYNTVAKRMGKVIRVGEETISEL
jgi:hypothetical protein